MSLRTHFTAILLLSTCPNLGSLKLYDRGSQPAREPHQASPGTYPQLHTLHLIQCGAPWQLPPLPSLTALLLEGSWQAQEVQCIVNQVASQLTRLRVAWLIDMPAFQPCLLVLRHNLQRLELPMLGLTDDVFKVINELLPELRCVEFGNLSLSSSHADVECSWRELRGSYRDALRQLAWLPLARADKPALRGLQRLVLEGVDCVGDSEEISASVATVCSSTCQLAPLHRGGEQRGAFALYLCSEDFQRVQPLLTRFAPDSIRSLALCPETPSGHGLATLPHPAMAALGAALATNGGMSALARCHTLKLVSDFKDAAMCAALLPMLMGTPISTLFIPCRISTAQLAAICCPGSLATVTRPITLRVESRSTHNIVNVEMAQAAVNAAGKAHLVRVVHDVIIARPILGTRGWAPRPSILA
jgi:hypothetical protein